MNINPAEISKTAREDIFNKYDIKNFESAFGIFFSLIKKKNIEGTKRTLYLMQSK